jgi:hypothetical protein
MDSVENPVSKNSSIVARELVAVGTCLFRGRYLVTGLHATICLNAWKRNCKEIFRHDNIKKQQLVQVSALDFPSLGLDILLTIPLPEVWEMWEEALLWSILHFKLLLFLIQYKIWSYCIFVLDKSFDIASRNQMSTFTILDFGIRPLIGPESYRVSHPRLWHVASGQYWNIHVSSLVTIFPKVWVHPGILG